MNDLASRIPLSKEFVSSERRQKVGGNVLCWGALYPLLGNPLYIGKTVHKGQLYDGLREAIMDCETWDRSRPLLARMR